MRRIANRILLTVVGLGLLVGGLAVVARSRGWLHDQLGDLLRTRDKPLITPSQTERLTDESWWWWVAFGVPGLLLVICLWWFFAQFRRRPVRVIRVADTSEDAGGGPSGLGTGFGLVGDDADTITVSGYALADAIADDLARIPGVESAHAQLVVRRPGPKLKLAIRTEAGAEPRDVLLAVQDEVVEHGRDAVELHRLPVEVELRNAGGLPRRHLQ
ncbi:alkaline shock response membrane anchor protein AmaP [Yinghuangia soli]|uniref:Alkaline shock response membrane anchor protein AmaP n=1 Tax=Yinghuangia soli TaxID=2908204 RepID=A0AA41Q7I2_9ACTN|nr:alkaline shock response membrane anchor protein AmaP [Yinghuangia soli]MCF2533035.1 alkaline shock response membrane anchor protein AmaP [Yinghuangia soli]